MPTQGTLRELPDYLQAGLKVVFVGFNPGVRSAREGHYYANPRNAFWGLLFESGLVPVRLHPKEDHRMPKFGLGLTDLVKRPTKSANELRASEIQLGRRRLIPLLERIAPRVVALNGKGVYRGLFAARQVSHGWQESLGDSRVFVLPSTSPANAGLPRVAKLRCFRQLARWVKNYGR